VLDCQQVTMLASAPAGSQHGAISQAKLLAWVAPAGGVRRRTGLLRFCTCDGYAFVAPPKAHPQGRGANPDTPTNLTTAKSALESRRVQSGTSHTSYRSTRVRVLGPWHFTSYCNIPAKGLLIKIATLAAGGP
jgi:hypothetical protein